MHVCMYAYIYIFIHIYMNIYIIRRGGGELRVCASVREGERGTDKVSETCFGWQGGVSVSRQTSPSTTSTSRTRCPLAEHAGQERRKPNKKRVLEKKKVPVSPLVHLWSSVAGGRGQTAVMLEIEMAGRGHINTYIIYKIYNICVHRLQLGR